MDSSLEAGLRAIDESAELAKSIRVDLDDEYLRAIALVESLPQNQAGSDKSWVWRTDEAFRAYFRRVKRT